MHSVHTGTVHFPNERILVACDRPGDATTRKNMAIKYRTPYENIVIGNFLYGMGLSLGTRAGAKAPLGSINNTQQTPLDCELADVWVKFPGISRLLEFKRRGSSTKKDLRKRAALEIGINGSEQHLAVSRRIHWFAEIVADEVGRVDLVLKPYIDFDKRASTTLSLSQYIKEFTDAALDPSDFEPSGTEVSAYLRLLNKVTRSGETSNGGLMVNVDQEGVLQCIPLSDIRDLGISYRAQLARDNALTHTIEQQREHDHLLKHQISKEKSHTPGL